MLFVWHASLCDDSNDIRGLSRIIDPCLVMRACMHTRTHTRAHQFSLARTRAKVRIHATQSTLSHTHARAHTKVSDRKTYKRSHTVVLKHALAHTHAQAHIRTQERAIADVRTHRHTRANTQTLSRHRQGDLERLWRTFGWIAQLTRLPYS